MKTAISIPDKLFEQAEATAKKLGVSRSNLFSQAIQEFINNYNPMNVTKKLNKIYNNESSNFDPNILEAQLMSIEKEDW